jgi:deoxyribodipyrimidine photo-lyase
LTQVETDVVVPVELVSNKAEYAARTIRPKIDEHLADFLVELRTTPLDKNSLNLSIEGLDLGHIQAVLDDLDIDRSIKPVDHLFKGGTSEAKRIFKEFLAEKFNAYAEHRNQPQTNDVSHMSKYLHFGQISPLYLALQVQQAQGKSKEDKDSFLEELIVRRELAVNFVEYTADYDSFSSLPDWARETLEQHKADERAHRYTRSELEAAETHDNYWNAAMREMKYSGYMHNYMRMYWGKKILEWCNTHEYAYQTTLYFNNKYFLDGRDANSFANVGWVFGLHDRGWAERDIFGKVRYMSASGLKRKADPEAYIEKIEALVEIAK